MRAIVLLTLVALAQGAPVAPLAAKNVKGRVQLSATMHSGCVTACKPSPVESKCVTSCETTMYKCIDETGPNETPKDTDKCQQGALKAVIEGIEKMKGATKAVANKTEGKKEEKKVEKKAEKKAKMFLQTGAADDFSDEAEADEEEESDASEGDEDSESTEEETQEDDGSEDESEAEDNDEEAAQQTDDEAEASSTDTEEEQEADESTDEAEEESDDETKEEESRDEAEDQMPEAESKDEAEEEDTSSEDEEQASDDEEEDSFLQIASSWKPEPCGELAPGVPCVKLYEHPQGSTVVMPCPVESQGNTEACGALFAGKGDGDQCPQITCSKAMGVTMKLTCGGGCCPTCWAPDHVIAVDRHTSIDDAAVVDAAPQAPSSCGGVKCFELGCATGFSKGFVNGDCCYSCVQGR